MNFAIGPSGHAATQALQAKPTREICDYCEGEHQGHLETPMLRTDIPNRIVRAEVKTEICEHCVREIAENLGEDWREEKERPDPFNTAADLAYDQARDEQ